MQMKFVRALPVLAVLVAATPLLAGAVTFLDTLNLINRFLNAVVPMIITIAIIFFFWGLAQLLLNAGEKRSDAIQTMIWGVVAIFVMVSIWGIIKLLQSTFKVGDTNPIVPKAIEISDTFRR
jgi:hypothetical protein